MSQPGGGTPLETDPFTRGNGPQGNYNAVPSDTSAGPYAPGGYGLGGYNDMAQDLARNQVNPPSFTGGGGKGGGTPVRANPFMSYAPIGPKPWMHGSGFQPSYRPPPIMGGLGGQGMGGYSRYRSPHVMMY